MIEKILDGKMSKYYEQVALLDQPWFREDKKKVSEIIQEAVAKIGENITVRRFARYMVGEGIEKKTDNLAEEVAKQVGAKA
jgi:elongation factor Ts